MIKLKEWAVVCRQSVQYKHVARQLASVGLYPGGEAGDIAYVRALVEVTLGAALADVVARALRQRREI